MESGGSMFEIITTYPVGFAIVIVVIIFLIKSKVLATNIDLVKLKESIIEDLKKQDVFVTPHKLSEIEKQIRADLKNEYLSLAVFKEFKMGIDRQFKTIFIRFDEGKEQFHELARGINEIKNYLLEERKK